MGTIVKSFVLLTSLIAACAGCTSLKPAPVHGTAGAAPAPPAGAATAPATGSPAASAPALPARHRPRARRSRAARPVPYGSTCQPAALRLSLGPPVSGATSQYVTMLALTNVSAAGCDLDGYPGVAVLGGTGAVLPFDVRWGGGQMLTRSVPALVPLAPGATAYLGIDKWACFGRTYATSRTVQVIPPNDYQPLTLTTMRRVPLIYYCPAGDPGHVIRVSPVEPSPRSVLVMPR
jgi:uncharacterized protein DUF4232